MSELREHLDLEHELDDVKENFYDEEKQAEEAPFNLFDDDDDFEKQFMRKIESMSLEDIIKASQDLDKIVTDMEKDSALGQFK